MSRAPFCNLSNSNHSPKHCHCCDGCLCCICALTNLRIMRAITSISLIVAAISSICKAQQRSDPTKFNGGSILAMAVSYCILKFGLTYEYLVFLCTYISSSTVILLTFYNCISSGPQFGSNCHRLTLWLGDANYFNC